MPRHQEGEGKQGHVSLHNSYLRNLDCPDSVPDARKLRNDSRYSIETSIPTTLTSMLLLFLQARTWRIYIKGLRVFTAIYLVCLYSHNSKSLSQNPVMAKQQFHFFELMAGPFGSGLSGKLAMSRKVEI
ncbi:hypothetical protein F2Q69_00027274 [Brassica cretica]|uniref:Uncharacterized protein n=1 Tax=Brassica cretica TaxID=69181 RepID=A0A8S9S9S0_BRACR|nr:hypothetical protein F2Q69_00027274 [Brassica cretica]